MRVMKQFEIWVAKQSEVFVEGVNFSRILVAVVDQLCVVMEVKKHFGAAVAKRDNSGIKLGVM